MFLTKALAVFGANPRERMKICGRVATCWQLYRGYRTRLLLKMRKYNHKISFVFIEEKTCPAVARLAYRTRVQLSPKEQSIDFVAGRRNAPLPRRNGVDVLVIKAYFLRVVRQKADGAFFNGEN